MPDSSKALQRSFPIEAMRAVFGDSLQEQVSLAGYSTARVGGPVDALITVSTAGALEQAALRLWELDVPFTLLGYGSNVLVSDSGFQGAIILNRARAITIEEGEPPSVWAESGAMLGTIARQVGLKGLSGFEWAATVPGTLGGAVYGNAGAYGGDMLGSLLLAEILQPTGKEIWPVERMQYQYRSSALKQRENSQGLKSSIILSARLRLEHSTPQSVQEKMEAFAAHRRKSQPPGASMGSMFKNPPGDYAGRLIEAAGLKGTRIGDAEISPIHGNFFINHGQASASDIGGLIRLAQGTVAQKFGIQLALEVELLGDWSNIFQGQAQNAGTGASFDDKR